MKRLSLAAVSFTVACAAVAFGVAGCGGGGGSSNVAPSNPAPNQPAPQSATATISLASTGAQALPSIGGISSSITLTGASAPAGAQLSITVSTGLPSSIKSVPAGNANPFASFSLTSSADATLTKVPAFTATLPSAPANQGQFYAWMYDANHGWSDLGTLTVSGKTVTFGGANKTFTMKAGVAYVIIPFTASVGATCPTPTPPPTPTPSPTGSPTSSPTPRPTPTGVVSCSTSGTGAIGVLCLSGHTYAFVPKGGHGSSTNVVSQVQIDATSAASHFTTSAGMLPTACQGDATTLKVFCISAFSDIIAVLDPVAHTESEFHSGASGSLGFSGGSCTNCGLVIDPHDSAIIVSASHSDGHGHYDVFSTSSHTLMKSIDVGSDMTENFGYNYVTNQIFQEPYTGSSASQIIDVASSKIYTNTVAFVGSTPIDHNAVDVATGIGLAADEFTDQIWLVDLHNAVLNSPSAGQFTASTVKFTFPSEINADCGIPNTVAGVASVSHLAFLTGEFGCNGPFIVAQMPNHSGAGPTISDFAWATPPTVPGGTTFEDGFDPHTIAVFSNTSCLNCAISLDARDNGHIAVIDLDKLIAAPRSGGAAHQVTSSSALSSAIHYFST